MAMSRDNITFNRVAVFVRQKQTCLVFSIFSVSKWETTMSPLLKEHFRDYILLLSYSFHTQSKLSRWHTLKNSVSFFTLHINVYQEKS